MIEDGYYFSFCKLICLAETDNDNGKEVIVRNSDNSNQWSETIADNKCEFQLPGKDRYTVILNNGEFTTQVEMGYGDCIGLHLAEGYGLVNQKDVYGTDEDWNTTKSYAVGDMVIHNNKLWQSKIQHSGQEPPNETYWENVSLSQLNSKLDKKIIRSMVSLPNVEISTNKIGTLEFIGTVPIPSGYSASDFVGYSINQFGSMDANSLIVTINPNNMKMYVYYAKVGYSSRGLWVNTLWLK